MPNFIHFTRKPMQSHLFITVALSLLLCAGSGGSHAADAPDTWQAGTLRVRHAHARATVPHQPSAAAYITIENLGKSGDKLLSLSSPAAKEVELHTMSMQGDLMRMRPLDALALKPAQRLVMKPGDGAHIMLIGLKKQLKSGDQFPLTLQFEKSGKLEVIVKVEAISVK
jgi:copper(I)-binding protein